MDEDMPFHSYTYKLLWDFPVELSGGMGIAGSMGISKAFANLARLRLNAESALYGNSLQTCSILGSHQVHGQTCHETA